MNAWTLLLGLWLGLFCGCTGPDAVRADFQRQEQVRQNHPALYEMERAERLRENAFNEAQIQHR